MEEIGIDISGRRSKSVAGCSRENYAPILGSATALYWNLEDPAESQGNNEERKGAFVRVRDELKGLILKFITSGSRIES